MAEHMNIDSTLRPIYTTPDFLVPEVGPNPARTIEAVALLTSLIVTNPMATPINVYLEIRDGAGNPFDLLTGLIVPANDFALIELSKQNLPTGESIWIRTSPAQNGVAHLSFVLNQREEYEEIV
jgi:hypothetical protein